MGKTESASGEPQLQLQHDLDDCDARGVTTVVWRGVVQSACMHTGSTTVAGGLKGGVVG